ncbi:MAG: ATP-binding protein [Spirochaetales bacterium]|uniref:ATP-binding protein n=1 Tax=Bullifex sp. TaxID=2815808 RepID=UPI002A51624F|nr:ATP-binding protein [Bullifex sp.]MDD5973689.1 ATP-binding protein [Spirochaetales bacterium]MDD7271355.1 ATP-binding protein [Spirochaetales bacterium]MDY4067142.1 ATP-binding protein [Bullifex sp.]
MEENIEKKSYLELVNGDIPPWVMRFVKGAGKAINRYNMIKEGDEVLLAVSGGKDSLALALALSLRLKWLPVKYKLKALMINWIEHPIDDEHKQMLRSYFEALSIDFKIVDENQFPSSFNGDFNCYLCSRNRRRILFEYAAQNDVKLIAMGHHLDDLVETTMMNLCFRANFSTMLPVQEFFDGKLHIIRPLIEIHESVTKRIAENYDLPVIKPVCPYDQTNIRSKLKPIIKELTHIDKLTREHIYNAHNFNIHL